jgi:phosphomannomutase
LCVISDEALPLGGLTFGTAGLRAPLGNGPGTMNRRVVTQAAAGIAAWLLDRETSPSVVIGHDARHQSDAFARELAEVLAGAGVDALLLPGPIPTPVLAFSIRHLGTSAGLMVTASHNPATDNGLKVYLDDTSQIAAPTDAEIAGHIARVGELAVLPRSAGYRHLDAMVVERYLDGILTLVDSRPRTLRVAYTPLHGVGADLFRQATARAGFSDVHMVAEQALPDPDFPTVAFPNPEEPGAMDQVVALAAQTEADIALAHDPDADRCAVAVRRNAEFRILSGDEVGVLLADHLARAGQTGTYASSLVSSTMLGKIADAHGLRWQQTLTGFKWIGKVPDLAYGYEEALGYCVAPHLARDKDGLAAGLVILELADALKSAGLTLLDRLDDLFDVHGAHLTAQVSIRLTHPDEAAALLSGLRSSPPTSLGGVGIHTIDDLSDGFRGLPPTDGLHLGFDGGRIIVRPSGTEPTLKCYIEVVADAQQEAQSILDGIRAELRDYFTTAASTGNAR